MLLVRLVGVGVDEHLHLVELVDPDDPPGVLAVGPGLAAEAGRPADVAVGQRVGGQDLAAVVPGQGHLGGAHEVEVVVGQAVDLVGVLTEETGALHGLGLDQDRRDHRGETGLDRLVHRHVEQGQLQLGAHSVRK